MNREGEQQRGSRVKGTGTAHKTKVLDKGNPALVGETVMKNGLFQTRILTSDNWKERK